MTITGPIVVLAVSLLFLGAWGRRNVTELAQVPGMTSDRIAKRERVMRRGALSCRVVGAVFLVVSVLTVVFPPEAP